jgi:uncharacterized protein
LLFTRAAGFDCGRANTQVEQRICDSKWLGVLDSQLDAAYAIALANARPAEKNSLKIAQNEWLRGVRDQCDNSDCLERAYLERVRALTHIETDVTTAEYVVDAQQLAERASSFALDLHRAGVPGKLTSCRVVIHVLGSDVRGSGRETSYGGICKIDNHDIMVCNDTMVGKLTVKWLGFTYTGSSVADFTQNNCPPGG